MKSPTSVGPTIIVILGATGDLTWRKFIPGLYNPFLDNRLPEKFEVIGVSRTEMDENAFRERMKEGVDKFSRRGKSEENTWNNFVKHVTYSKGGFDETSTYDLLKNQIEELEKNWNVDASRIFYMAVPPDYFERIATKICDSKLAENKQLSRIVIEKPFGRDCESA